ncbi:MerR family transcriptional regulator [Mangrovibrevibacter kandeliae]|uniref:MerR family transcriptional regulator n=1 Tax=Mangrovibrevibacter kandeliae TaxID=2968473 RepID=UPI00211741B3|nr:MerR family DNA-binding transcriptional regulator [Aurantimonas sp. CSK15Z-1]MCQ8784190.1 MerR family DNA-binding transcriptional regulator [Aurantimonas sp. CSK15Z-1]
MTQLDRIEDSSAALTLDVDFLLGLREDPEPEQAVFRIGDLAKEFGVTLRTLRFYEDRGLLKPERRGTTRLYSRADRARLRLILLAKTLGFSLTEAKQLIEVYHQPNGKRIALDVALERFEEQQQVLRDQQAEIEASLQAMEVTVDHIRRRMAEADV